MNFSIKLEELQALATGMSGVQGSICVRETGVNKIMSSDFRVLGKRKQSLRADSTLRKCKFLAKQCKQPSQSAFTLGSPHGLLRVTKMNGDYQVKGTLQSSLLKNKNSLHPGAARAVLLSPLINISFLLLHLPWPH